MNERKELKVVAFSDTHNYHNAVNLPQCDIAIFSGDFSSRGSERDTRNFLKWYSSQDQCKHKIFIGGNHDLCLDEKFNTETGAGEWLDEVMWNFIDGRLIYLENKGCEIEGVKIWGSPITPDFHPEYWAFNKPRGQEINKIWKTIPFDTDIVITHGPPAYIGDYVPRSGKYTGCNELRYTMEEIKPKFHIFGHIHEGYGVYEYPDTVFINASICNEFYEPINKPIEFYI